MNLVEEYTSINRDNEDMEFRYAYRLIKKDYNGTTAYGIEIERKDYVGLKNGNLEKAIWFNLGFIKNAIWFRNRQYRSNYGISLYHDIGYSDGCSWIVRDDHELTIQSDGNLVYYKKKKPLWYSGTNGNWGAVLIMQSDGNLVIYTTNMKAIWSSGTSGRKTTHAEFLVDGRFVIKNKEEFVKKLN